MDKQVFGVVVPYVMACGEKGDPINIEHIRELLAAMPRPALVSDGSWDWHIQEAFMEVAMLLAMGTAISRIEIKADAIRRHRTEQILATSARGGGGGGGGMGGYCTGRAGGG